MPRRGVRRVSGLLNYSDKSIRFPRKLRSYESLQDYYVRERNYDDVVAVHILYTVFVRVGLLQPDYKYYNIILIRIKLLYIYDDSRDGSYKQLVSRVQSHPDRVPTFCIIWSSLLRFKMSLIV